MVEGRVHEHRVRDRGDRGVGSCDLETFGADRDDFPVAEAVERAGHVAGEDAVGSVRRGREAQVDAHHGRCGLERGGDRPVLAGALEQRPNTVVVAAQARDDRREERADRNCGGHGLWGVGRSAHGIRIIGEL